MSPARRPPKRRCPGCGGDYYAWTEGSACRRCLAEGPGPVTAHTAEQTRRSNAAARAAGHRTDDIPY